MRTKKSRSGVLVLSDEIICEVLTLEQTMRLVEGGFAADALGRAVALPVVVRYLDTFGVNFGIKSGYIMQGEKASLQPESLKYLSNTIGNVLGLKAGGYWVRNSEMALPPHRAVLVLLNPENGDLIALMSANAITRLRTAAAGAVGAKYLARENSQVVGVIGAGEQAHAQLAALRTIRPISRAYVWARRPDAAEAYAAEWENSGVQVEAVKDIRKATEDADVIITATSATSALVRRDSVSPGTHVNAVGSDGKGKQELDVDLLQCAKVVVDNVKQSLEIGELQHVVREGLDANRMIHAELGEICAGMNVGRENEKEITIFDSTGVSFQDLVVAAYLVRRARSEEFGSYVTL